MMWSKRSHATLTFDQAATLLRVQPSRFTCMLARTRRWDETTEFSYRYYLAHKNKQAINGTLHYAERCMRFSLVESINRCSSTPTKTSN